MEPTRPEPPCERILRLEVHKSSRTLAVFCDAGQTLYFPVALGRNPVGPKEQAGDLRTPEGEYRVAGPPRHSRFHLFIPIDYPSAADAERALRDGIISPDTYARIVDAEGTEPPPQDSPLGGYLGLHGEGRRWKGESRGLDWTNGCIALADAHIEFLAQRVDVGTPVSILP